ncbi:Tetratricopeptide repeat protein 28 [Stylophora pistillata]|uniref:Tetratricopeptide repeat protein 28 n=1 Tax=Stylophora pistillata TaxID=50429 RepID=A0A2B4SBV1_STYPI|nr:Tetratricopeptide repeat protein 28 [Stylophora pistillata]
MESGVEVLQAVIIGISIAIFLLNIKSYVKSAELFRECLVLLSSSDMTTMQEILDVRKKLILIVYSRLGTAYYFNDEFESAIDCYYKALALAQELGDKKGECTNYGNLGSAHLKTEKYMKAVDYSTKALEISKAIGSKREEGTNNGNLGTIFQCLGDFSKSLDYHKKSLEINEKLAELPGQAQDCKIIGDVCKRLGDPEQAIKYYENAVLLKHRIRDRRGECDDADKLAELCLSVGKFKKAEFYQLRALEISQEIGGKEEQHRLVTNLGVLYDSIGEYSRSKECQENALTLARQAGDVKQEALSLSGLGTAHGRLGNYEQAMECLVQALAMRQRIGDKSGEATTLGNLSLTYHSFGQYSEAEEHLQRSLEINLELNNRGGEGANYGNLGVVFHARGEFLKAINYHEKALQIRRELGDKRNESIDYHKIALAYESLANYSKALEYQQKSLQLSRETAHPAAVAKGYCNLASIYHSLGERAESFKYIEESLKSIRTVEDKLSKVALYDSLGTVFNELGDYDQALTFIERALELSIEMKTKWEEGEINLSLADLYRHQGDFSKSLEYGQRSLDIFEELGNKRGKMNCHLILGSTLLSTGEYTLAIKNHEKAFQISNEIGDRKGQGTACAEIGLCLGWVGDISRGLQYLLKSVNIYEGIRGFLGDEDQFKVSFVDANIFPYQLLVCFLCQSEENVNKAIYTAELGRARGLADLMSKRYFIQGVNQGEELKVNDIETLLLKEDCTILYIAYHVNELFLWVIKPNQSIKFRKVPREVMEAIPQRLKDVTIDQLFESLVNTTYAHYNFGRSSSCEDRSFFTFEAGQKCSQPQPRENPARLCEVEEDDDDDEEFLLDSSCKTALRLWYDIIIAPVKNLLEGSKIIVVPEGELHKVPFQALEDESGKYLSETYEIRVVPSLTTLKLIHDSPEDYHSERGVLIVGDPEVGEVLLNGEEKHISGLPCARMEAEMISKLLELEPSRILLGKHATKHAVLQELSEVSLIHFAAHGDAFRDEICLAPIRCANKIPEKDDFILTMSDVSKVQLRAKLVVLSCCHSGRGEIKAEGVVGIARAFLGSGARSVLASLWAVDDKATLQFMKQFYDHLVRGKSASESLHETMNWMRRSTERRSSKESGSEMS